MIRLKSLEIFNFKRYEHEELKFPLQGRFLIKGKNEAGKSTLFEAIVFALFGRPVYINGKENLINFSQDKAQVILNLDLDDKEIYIKRTLERNASQKCLFKIYNKKNPEKSVIINKVNDANERIERELGLDYITLLNTCFVEQKNIGRLENSDKATRQKIIISLFNLEFLTDLSKRAKEEKENLREKLLLEEIIRETCSAKRKYPILNEEFSKIKKEKTEIEAIEKAKRIKEEKEGIDNIDKEIERLSKVVEEYKEKVETLRKSLEELNKLEKIFEFKKRSLEKIEAKERIENKINQDLEKIKEIPKLEEEINNLKYLIKIKKRVEKTKKIRDKFVKIDDNLKSLIEERKEIERILKKSEDLNKYEEDIRKINIALKSYTIKITSSLSFSIILFLLSFSINIFLLPLSFIFIMASLLLFLRRNTIKEEKIKLNIRKEDIEKEFKIITPISLKEPLEKIQEKIFELEEFKKKKETQWERVFGKITILDKYPEKDLESLNREESKLEERVENLKNLSLEVEKNKGEIIKIENEVKTLQEEAENLSKMLMKGPSQEYKEQLEKTIKDLKGEKVEDKFEYYRKVLDQKNGEKKARKENLEGLIREFSDNYPEKIWEELSEKEIDYKIKEKLEKREKEVSEELSRIKFIMERYEKNTGKKIEDLDPDKEEENINKMLKEKIKMYYAQQILEGSAKKILDTVSPRTLTYMQKILPILTMDRYHVVHLDAEIFKLKVYDNITNKYYDKEILSGGTQDQFSLALRLAFAMANLPQDKGTNPGFIFLDEPLGSFDEDRAYALVELLTHGEIAEHFDQIFVITHVLLREEFFDYYIHIEDGKIIYKDI